MSHRPLVIVSNRGPVGHRFGDDGKPVPTPPAGGLATGLRPLLEEGTTWVAAAVSDADRAAVRDGGGRVEADGLAVRMLTFDPGMYRMAYDVVANASLWFLHHGLWDLPRRPAFDRYWFEAWEAFRAYNTAFAEVVAETAPGDAVVLVQDYHLPLVAEPLRRMRPALATVHFSHTPFAGAEGILALPTEPAHELLGSMAQFDACGFHTARWAERFAAACAELDVGPPATFAAPLAPDVAGLQEVAAGAACDERLVELESILGDRAAIVRVDRLELSKNVLRGFLAYEALLERREDLRDRVVFVASLYPSREGVLDYLAYEQEVRGLARRINSRFGSSSWEPIVLDIGDDFPRSVAALRRYDVLLVNPLRDGLNLVAHEGPAVNERAGVVCLSREAGAFERLAPAVEAVHPFDVTQTAEALERALAIGPEQRRARAQELSHLIAAWTPRHWLDANLAAVPAP